MLLHYLKVAWRNLLKYKTQNVISILSLSVGVVLFAIVLQTLKGNIPDIYYSEIDTGIVNISAYRLTEEQLQNRPILDENSADIQYNDQVTLTTDFVNQIQSLELPSIREIKFMATYVGLDTEFEVEEGKRKKLYCKYASCSPRYLHYFWFRSEITGKRIPELRDGDIIITDDIRDKIYGKDVDPRGFTIKVKEGKTSTIRDVVNMSERFQEFGNATIIEVNTQYHIPTWQSPKMRVELAEGATPQQLREELSAAIPEYYFTYIVNDFDWHDEGAIFIIYIVTLLLLGSSILIISVTGFLKMQLQLFSLRSRELALRRTMGAHPRHLIMLLAVEIIIVFLFVAGTTAVVSVLLTNYIMPILYNITPNGFSFDIDGVYNLEKQIITGTLLITILIASLTIRRQLRRPVGMYVGRSGHPRTKGKSIILCIQFAISMLLISALFGVFYLINDTLKHQQFHLPDNLSPYRKAIKVNTDMLKIPDFYDKLEQLEEIEHITNAIRVECEAESIDTEAVTRAREITDNDGNFLRYSYTVTITDEHIFDYLKIKINPECPTEENIKKRSCAVYVRTEEIERLRKKWGIEISPDTRVKNLYEEHSYTLIGYAPALHHYHYNAARYNYAPVLWIVDDINSNNYVSTGLKHKAYAHIDYIIFPKGGKYGKCEDAITATYRESLPGDMNDIPMTNLYDSWFPTLRIMNMIRNISVLIVFISILCVITNLYSNIALESRGRQKEVALRKIHGAKRRDIMLLFGKYYIRLLLISATFVTTLVSATAVTMVEYSMDGEIEWTAFILYLMAAIISVAIITLGTIGHKIFTVSNINAADIIKKE